MTTPYDNIDGESSTTDENPYDDVLEESGGEIYSKQDEQDDRLDDLETDVSALQTSVTTAETDIDSLETRMDTAEGDIDDLEDLRDNLEINGFENRTDSTMSFTEGTRVFSIAPSSTSFSYWIGGVKYTKSAEETITIANTEGMHYIYYDGATLSEAVNPSMSSIDSVIRTKAIVAIIYWDSTNSKAVYYGEERHGMVMSGSTHSYLHFTDGLAYVSGLAPTDVLTEENGSSNTHAQVGISAGAVSDEDIYLPISAIASTAGYRVMYRDGASGNWRHEDVSGYPFIKATDRPCWNEFTGGSWTKTEVTNNDFVLVHLFASTSIDDPIFVIMGQNEYANRGSAREGANTEIRALLLDSLPTPEITTLATLILQCKDGYANEVNCRFVTTDDGDDYIDWRTQRGLGSGGDSASSGALDYGTPATIGKEYIDGSTNAIDTNITLVDTTTSHYEEVDISIVNTNNFNCTFTIAHVDGAIGALADDDYLCQNETILANETKPIPLPCLEVGHSLMVRANKTGINFIVKGRTITNPKVKRIGSVDIDGSTNAVSTNIEVVTSAINYTELSLYVCNRNSTEASLYSIYNVDSTDIGDLADEDVVIYEDTLLPNELFYDIDLIRDFPTGEMVTFSSDIEDVNIIAYAREV
jgi:hypothetical protein